MSAPSASVQRVMAWCGLAFVAVYGAGIGIAGFLPPPSPDENAAEISRFFAENTGRIRTGTLLMMLGAAISIPFFAVLTMQMRRIEGRFTGLCLAQLLAGGIAVWVFTLPPIIFAVAAFRPGQDENITQMLNDLGWFLFVWNLGTVTCQAVIIAVAIGFLPGALLTYFKTGIMAWDGLLAFWLAATLFFAWILVLFWSTLRAVNREALESGKPALEREVPV